MTDLDGPLRPDEPWEAVDEGRMRQMLEFLPAYAVMIDRSLKFRWVNRLDPALRADQVLGHHVREFVHPDDFPRVAEIIERVFATGETQSYETRGFGNGQMESWYRTTVVHLPAVRDEDARALLLSRDITQQHLAQRAVSESERRFRKLTEASPDVIVIVDGEQRVTYLNRPLVPPGSSEPLDVIGCSVRELAHPDDADVAVERVDTCLRTGEPTSFTARGSITGRQLAVRVNRLSEPGAPLEALMSFTDVTEQQRAEGERRELETQLHHAQKLDTVGRLAGGVAHDFNNLLVMIQGHLDFALEAVEAGDDPRQELGAIRAAAQRAGEMTQQLLTIGRKQPPKRQSVELEQVVRRALVLLRRVVPSRIELVLRSAEVPLPVHVDPSQLEQVVINLCLNARDAIAGRGRITFRLSRHDELATLEVIDTGRGMSDAVAARVFEPFFTTKGPGEGTGLGLSVAHSLVTQNEGALSLRSAPSEGTTMRLDFPIRAAESRAPPPTPAPAGAASESVDAAGTTILLAEDEPAIRGIIERILRRAGYRVLIACDGEQAVGLFREHADDVDMLLLDVVMPTMGGRDAFEQIQRLRPDIKALFSSGYAAEALPPEFLEAHGLRVLQKPYQPAQLLDAVQAVLASE